jgi:WD40 repeat protein
VGPGHRHPDRSPPTGGPDAGVLVWDLITGAPIDLLHNDHGGHYRAVYTVATTELNGRTVIVAGGEHGTIRTWGS